MENIIDLIYQALHAADLTVYKFNAGTVDSCLVIIPTPGLDDPDLPLGSYSFQISARDFNHNTAETMAWQAFNVLRDNILSAALVKIHAVNAVTKPNFYGIDEKNRYMYSFTLDYIGNWRE